MPLVFVWLVKHLALVKPATAIKPNSAMTMHSLLNSSLNSLRKIPIGGFGLCFSYLRHVESCCWNHKRVYRIYCELALNLRIKPRRRLKRHAPEPLKEPIRENQVWSLDFMHDQLSDGRKFR